jgi:hypothetical protein
VAQHATPETQCGPDAPSSVDVKLEPRPGLDHADAGNVGRLLAIPLPQREVRDLVALLRKPFRERAKPALAAADGVRVEAVVNQADAQIEDSADLDPDDARSARQSLSLRRANRLSSARAGG